MRFEKMWTIVDSHTGGMGTRLVIGGFPPIPGKTMKERVEYFERNLKFMTSVALEPRIHDIIVPGIIAPPVSEKADFSLFFMGSSACIHGTIGAVTTLIECGLVSPAEPTTEVKLDTPWGFIVARAHVRRGRVRSVTIRNVPCFFYAKVNIDLPKINKSDVPVNIAYGGDFYAYMNADCLGVQVLPQNLTKLLTVAAISITAIRDEIKRQGIKIQHPEIPERTWGGSVIICDKPVRSNSHGRQCMIGFRDPKDISTSYWDRSPCGTGTSGLLACLYAEGKLGLNKEYVNESIIGSVFRGKLVSKAKVGKYEAVIPEITGSAWINLIGTQVVDPDDPFKYGLPSEVPFRWRPA